MSKTKKAFALFGTILCGLFLGGLLGMTAPSSKGPQSMNQLKVKDLPEYGLSIVAESAPTFDSRLLTCVRSTPPASLEALKRFSVFVVNNGNQPVAALVVNWEFMQPDGKTVSKYVAVRQQGLFYTGNAANHAAGAGGRFSAVEANPVIEPNSSRLVSLLDATAISPQDVQFIKDRTDVPDDVKQKAQTYTAGQIDHLTQMVKKSVGWSVSIDGVFFGDGTFAGPDKTGFFDIMKAELDARFDLYTEIANLMTQPQSENSALYETVFKYVQSIAGSGKPKLSGFTANDFYKHKKSMLALQILTNRKTLGDEKTIDFVRDQLNEPRIQIIKQ